MAQEQERFIVRLPDGLRDVIRERAAASRRSMNAEIVFHLERAYLVNEAREASGGDAARRVMECGR